MRRRHHLGHHRGRGRRRAVHAPGPAAAGHPGRGRRHHRRRGRLGRVLSPARWPATATSASPPRCPTRWPALSAALRRRVEAAQVALRDIPDDGGRRRHRPRHPGPPGGHRPARRPRRGGGARRCARAVRHRPRARAGAAAGAARRGRPAPRAPVVAPHRGAHQRHPGARASGLTSGLPQRADELLDVGSPFDYPANGLIYCAARLPRPTDPRWADARHRRAGRARRRRRRPYARPVHQLQGHEPRGRCPAYPPALPAARTGRPAQAGAGRPLRRRARDLPVRHHELLAGHRRPRPVAVVGDHRPAAVPPAGRPAAAGPARARRRRGVRRHRRAAGGHAAGPGRRPPHPHVHRPRRGRRARSAPGHRSLRAQDRGHAAPDAPHP